MQTSPIAERSLSAESAIRLRTRFQIHSSCRFWWTCYGGDLNFGYGTTRNVSSGGVSIVAAGAPGVGAAILVEIDLNWDFEEVGTEFAASPSGERVLRVEGRVVRHEEHDADAQQIGFAVMATQATIEAAPFASEDRVFEEHYA